MNLKFDIEKLTIDWNLNQHDMLESAGLEFDMEILTQKQMSEKIQNHAFSLGYRWGSRGDSVKNTDQRCLFLDASDNTITYADSFIGVRGYEEATLDFFQRLSWSSKTLKTYAVLSRTNYGELVHIINASSPEEAQAIAIEDCGWDGSEVELIDTTTAGLIKICGADGG